jgi:hypothetical protein
MVSSGTGFEEPHSRSRIPSRVVGVVLVELLIAFYFLFTEKEAVEPAGRRLAFHQLPGVSVGAVVHRLAPSLWLHGHPSRHALPVGPGGQHCEGHAGVLADRQLRPAVCAVATAARAGIDG